MKKILMAIAVLGLTYTAQAQSSAKSKFAKNYNICLKDGSYQVCTPGKISEAGRTTVKETEGYITMETTSVHMGSSPATVSSASNRGRIRVMYDDMNDPYMGRESMANDGVQKNKIRNINTNNGAYNLPPNDGGR